MTGSADEVAHASTCAGPARRRWRRPRPARRSWPARTSSTSATASRLLFDEGSFVEDGQLANALARGLPADGVVTGQGLVDGRPALVVANDPTVKAGSWGARTVEKIIRVTERALREELPIFWLIDSAGARITDQVALFPGRRGAGRIFHNQVALSGKVPQICCLFGPSAAGGAYIPAFCDIVIMVEGNASMYLGSPADGRDGGRGEGHAWRRWAARGCTAPSPAAATTWPPTTRTRSSRPGCSSPTCRRAGASSRRDYAAGAARSSSSPTTWCRLDESVPFDVHEVIDGLVDDDSFFEVKPLFAAELVTGFGRIDGRPVGVVANNSRGPRRGAVRRLGRQGRPVHLAVRRVQHPAALPGRRPGLHDRQRGRAAGHHPARREDDHRGVRGHRAAAVGDRAQGLRRRAVRDGRAGLHARCLHRAADRADRGDGAGGRGQRGLRQQDRGRSPTPTSARAFVADRRAEYEEDVDLLRLASDLVLDAVIEPAELRRELVLRLTTRAGRDRRFSDRRHGVPPV